MKMTPAKIADIKRKKEAREKSRPGRLKKPNTQLNPESFTTGPQKPTETTRLRRPKMGPKPKQRQLDPKKMSIEQKGRKFYKQQMDKLREGKNIGRTRIKKMGGGMMQMPRAMYGKGGGVCKRGMGRAYGKNS